MDPLLSKKKNEDIEKLFDDISGNYDFLNHFLSLNIDKHWRKKLIALLIKEKPECILDLATGTADMAIAAAQQIASCCITGIDISEKMLEIGRKKIRHNNLDDRIELLKSSAEKLPFADDTFDNAMVAFGVRNFHDLQAGISEMQRVIKPGKKIFILEFSRPHGFLKFFNNIYFKIYLPVAGKLISGNSFAYRYLYDSVVSFPEDKAFTDIMKESGIFGITQYRLSGGISTIYIGEKQKNI